jgi:hypothetical protein
LGGPTSSYATAGIALRVTEARKLPHHVKVETPSGESMKLLMEFNLETNVAFLDYVITFKNVKERNLKVKNCLKYYKAKILPNCH